MRFAWRPPLADVDGEPAVALLTGGSGEWVSTSLIRLDVTDGRVSRIADYWHTPWLVQASPALVVHLL